MRKIFFICSSILLLLAVARQSTAQKKAGEFLISIYSPPPTAFMNDAQYRAMKEGYVDRILNIGPGVANDKEGNLKTLDMAEKHGMKVYVFDARISGTNADIEALVKDYTAHPALAGYYITDEPDSARLQWAIDTHKK